MFQKRLEKLFNTEINSKSIQTLVKFAQEGEHAYFLVNIFHVLQVYGF